MQIQYEGDPKPPHQYFGCEFYGFLLRNSASTLDSTALSETRSQLDSTQGKKTHTHTMLKVEDK